MKKTLASILNFLDRDFSLSKRQVLFAVITLLIIGLGLRCGYWTIRDRPPRDEQIYIMTVEKMNVNDNSWENEYNSGSLMPQLASWLCRTGLPVETALHILNMGYAILWILIMFLVCRDVFDDDNAGLLGMAFATFNPYSVRMASQILREPLYILLFTLSLWCAVRVIRCKGINLLYPAIIGALTILGLYTRLEGLEIALFLPVAMIIIFVQYRKKDITRCIYSLTVYTLTIVMLVAGLAYSGNNYVLGINNHVVTYYNLLTSERIKK